MIPRSRYFERLARAVPLSVAVILACHATSHTPRVGSFLEAPALTKADSDVDTARVQFLSDVEIAARIRPLKRTVLPPGTRELRFWLIGGWAGADLYRIISRNGRAEGQWIRFWELDSDSAMASGGPARAVARYGMEGKCAEVRAFHDQVICISRFAHEPDWASLLRRLESDSAWTLPDQKRNIGFLDGAEILVELRDGERYRTYDYDVTCVRENDVDSKRAVGMWKDLETLSALVPGSTDMRSKRDPRNAEIIDVDSVLVTRPWPADACR